MPTFNVDVDIDIGDIEDEISIECEECGTSLEFNSFDDTTLSVSRCTCMDDAERESGYEDGYNAGHDVGYTEGLADGDQQIILTEVTSNANGE